MTLRQTLKAQIYSVIDRSKFTISDFEIIYDGPSDNDVVTITFVHNRNYFLVLKEAYSTGLTLMTAPGNHKTIEKKKIETFDALPPSVESWLYNLREELRAAIPVYAEIDELRAKIEEFVASKVDEPEAKFTFDEAEELRKKLDDMAAQFSALQEEHSLTQQELNRMNVAIESIKENISYYSKGVWYKTAATKLWDLISKVAGSKESRTLIAKAAQKSLGLDP